MSFSMSPFPLRFGSRQGGGGGSAPDPDLVLVYDTSLAAGEDVEIPLFGTVNVSVDWGDAQSDDYTTAGVKAHTYAAPGTYTVRISGSLTGFGYQAATGTAARIAKLTQCTSFGDIGLTSLDGGFKGASNLTVAPASLPSTVTNLASVFNGCSTFNYDIGGWNTASVTNLTAAFAGCALFNKYIGGWNITSVTTMSSLFLNAGSFNQNLSAWDTSNVESMISMFLNAASFNQSLATFDLSGLTASSRLNGIANGAAIDTANYDATLIAWNAAKAGYRSDLSPHFGASKYSAGAAATARAALVTYGWSFTDGGQV